MQNELSYERIMIAKRRREARVGQKHEGLGFLICMLLGLLIGIFFAMGSNLAVAVKAIIGG